jgi:hypothetical protein
MKKLVLGVALASVLSVFAPAAVADSGSGSNDGRVIREGNCSGASDWKLKAKPEDGGLEVEFEVDQNVNGQEWRVTLKRNGVVFFRGIRTTQPPSGSFEVERRTPNGPGEDHFVGRARNLSTDELCRGSVRI